MKVSIDPILISVINNRLDGITKEIGETMLRTSRSPIFSEARDFCTAVFDRHLRLVAQTAYIPVLMGALPYAMRSIYSAFKDDIRPGDVFILNDPYRGNNHPPDITVAKPVFYKGELAFWSVSKGHHADVGGGGVAGYNPAARSIHEECVRIPPAKLYDGGKPNRTMWDLILLNVHIPFLVEGDLHCQVGACNVGERGILSLLDKYGQDTVDAAIDEILDASERQMRDVIRGIPNGTYSSERLIDHDGINKDKMIAIRLKLVVEDERIVFDYSESDPQAAGYVNSTLPNTASTSFLALFTSVASHVRFNDGALRALDVVAPVGTIANAAEPAPVTSNTISASQTIVESVWLAIAKAVPEAAPAAWARWCAPATMGFNPRTGRFFADIHFMCKGGGGASLGVDGWDHVGVIVCSGGLRSPDPELHELVNPYLVLNYEYRQDSAGAGKWRGGMGTKYSWKVLADGIPAANFGGGINDATAPYGLQGGLAAPKHQLCLKKATGETIQVDAESFYMQNIGDVFEIYESGGGGYGNPLERDINRVQADVRDGLVSVQKARDLYGVVVDPATFEVDHKATRQLRNNHT